MGIFTKDNPKPEGAPQVRNYGTFRTITASGQKIKVNDKKDIDAITSRKRTNTWQQEAWEYFDAIGEIKYAYTVFSNVLSRIRLYVAYVENDQDSPTPLDRLDIDDYAKKQAFKAMKRVFGPGNQSQLLKKAGLNLLVAGECFLICETRFQNGTTKEVWRIVSTDELIATDQGLMLRKNKESKQQDLVPLSSNAFVGRIWKEHPRFSDDPDSAMRALCDICNELLLVSRTVRNSARSKLNAGIFFVPEEFSVSSEAPTDTEEGDMGIDAYIEEEDQELEEAMIDHLTTPVSDEASLAALMPMVLRGPADLGEKLLHISFDKVFDPELTNRADRALERIMQGLDMPKEMITGLADIKYSNAVQINESFYTAHIEPLVVMMCDVFKTVYLEPALQQAGVDQDIIDNIVIWYDPSGIVTAPDKSAAANVGHDKFALSNDAWRKANGFTEDDAPNHDEVIKRIAISRGVLTPELTDTIFRQLFPEVMEQVRQSVLENQGAPMPDSVSNLLDPNSAQAPPANPAETAGDAPVETSGDAPVETAEPTQDDMVSADSEEDPDNLPTPEELLRG